MSRHARENMNVLRRFLKTASDGADVTWKVVPCVDAGNWNSSTVDRGSK